MGCADSVHPAGLRTLYLTEVWERFLFYGLKSLLVLYLNSGVLQRLENRVLGAAVVKALFGRTDGSASTTQALSSQINQFYSGAAYITPLVGGYVADRVLSARMTLVTGGMLMAAGHACMAYEPFFLLGLLLLVLGNGGFKPTITSILSRLYEPAVFKNLRDRGFAIFYTGINVGAVAAPLVCGALQQHIGYQAGFGAAGIGMLIGLATFFAGSAALPDDADLGQGKSSSSEPLLANVQSMPRWKLEEIGALIGMCASIIPFWVCFEQWSNTVPLFFRDFTERQVLGFEIPAAWLQSFNPLGCIALMPVLTTLWAAQSRRGAEPDSCFKMAIGCVLQALAWLVMAFGSAQVDGSRKAPLALPLIATILLTSAQLYLAPVGLALISRCCPPHRKSTATGAWFLAGGVGGLLAGPVGVLYSSWPKPIFFFTLSLLCLMDAALVALMTPRLKRIATGEDLHIKRKREGTEDSDC